MLVEGARSRPSWFVDRTWTGDWSLPALLSVPLSDEERAALVTLSVGGMGPAGLARELRDAQSVGDVLKGQARMPRPTEAMDRVVSTGARVLVPGDEEYPAPLRAIDAPPPLLYVRGQRLDRLAPMVAIVGSRACTRGASRFARRLGASLTRAGFTVVSGLARGIDGFAHEGALETGRTLAVLGTGIDKVYPTEHGLLADRVLASGALVTEFPPGVGPRAWHFPARNRIVSGLSLAVIVVEAGVASGALITAGFALEQGRDVYACLTGPENPAGAGVREMLREGAPLVIDPDDTAEELAETARAHGYDLQAGPAAQRTAKADLDGDRRIVYEAITDGTSVDEIISLTGLSVPQVAPILASLELDGLVSDDGAGRWHRE